MYLSIYLANHYLDDVFLIDLIKWIYYINVCIFRLPCFVLSVANICGSCDKNVQILAEVEHNSKFTFCIVSVSNARNKDSTHYSV